jgi:hypothetical protein
MAVSRDRLRKLSRAALIGANILVVLALAATAK